MQPIKYDALQSIQSQKTQDTADQFLANPKKAPAKTRRALIELLGIVLVAFVLFAFLPGALKILAVVIGLVALIIYGARSTKKQNAAVQKFVADNNWQFVAPPIVTIPSLTRQGDPSRVDGQAVSGTFGTVPFMLYTYTTGPTNHEMRGEIVTLQLPGQLPTITLNAIATNILGSSLVDSPAQRGLVEIGLEGNFQQSFKVYMEPGEQINVLEILTPELLQKMIDDGSFFNIDITGNMVHVISNYTQVMYPYVQQQLDFSQLLASSLSLKLQTYNAGVTTPTPTQPVVA